MDSAAEIFVAVKPICSKLAKLTLSNDIPIGSVELLNTLKDLNKKLNGEVSKCLKNVNDVQFFIPVNLSDYIMVPLTNLLKNDSITDSELEQLLSIMYVLLKYSWCQPGVLSNELFIQYVTLITFLIGGKPGNFSIKNHSDETFQNGIECIQTLLQGCLNQSSKFIENVLNNNKFVPTLGYLVSILLNVAVDSNITHIKVEALKALNVLYHLLNSGEILSLFFPGSVSSIAKIIKSKPHSDVIVESFITLSTLVVRVFSDFDLNVKAENKITSLESLKGFADLYTDLEGKETTLQSDSNLLIEIPENISSNKQHRTSAWLKLTLPQFNTALKIILNIDVVRYDKYNVKDSIYQFGVKIIRNCLISCYPLIPIILRSLSSICAIDPTFITPTVDSLIYVTEADSLKSTLHDLLDEELHSMQYKFSSPDPLKAENMIQFISLLMNILGGMDSIDCSIIETIIKKLQENVTLLIEIKNKVDLKKKIISTSNVDESMSSKLLLVSDHYKGDSFNEIHNVALFNGIFTKETEIALNQLFVVLASNIQNVDELNNWIFLDDASIVSNLNYVSQSVSSWIISSIIKNIKSSLNSDVDEFLQFDDEDEGVDDNGKINDKKDESWDLQINLSYSSLELSTAILKQVSNITENSFNYISSSILSLRVVDNSIKVLGEDFQDELIYVLYPIVECLASSNELVRIEAQLVILNIAELLYNGSIETLLAENTDYLVDSLSSKLVSESLTPKIPIILSILVKIGSMNIVAELDDIIRTIFTLLDMYHGYISLIEGFFLVFDEILSKIYKDLKDYSFEQLEMNCADENVFTFGMWGLKSIQEVDDFISKKAVMYDDLVDSDDDEYENENNIADEPLRKSKILEIDSDSDDSNDETDTKSIPSQINDSKNDDDNDDFDKWVSPLDVKLYTTVTNILSYAERLVQSNSVVLTILLLKIIKKIIPLLATQKSKFLPIGSNLWEVISSILNVTNDLRVVGLCISNLKEMLRYGQTFFTSRFIDLFEITKKNTMIKLLISKQTELLNRSKTKQHNEKVIINKTSTSTNWDLNTFNIICEYFIFALNKLGRFIPNDIAMSIISITIYYDDDFDHYGYFDDLAIFLSNYESIGVNNDV